MTTSYIGVVATYVPTLMPPQTGPPSAPTSLQASVSGNALSLTWGAPTTGAPVANYTLLARLAPGGAVVASLPVGAVTSFGITAPNGTFVISLTGTNAFGTGPESSTVTVTLPQAAPAPGAPVGLGVSVLGTTATFTWGAPASGGAPSGYALLAGIERRLRDALRVGAAAGCRRAPSRFRAFRPASTTCASWPSNAGGTSPASNEVMLTVVAPSAPAAPTLNAPVVSGNTASFSWTPGSGGGAPTSYLAHGGGDTRWTDHRVLPVAGTSISVPGVPTGTYYVRVSGVNSVGAGAASNAVTVVVP